MLAALDATPLLGRRTGVGVYCAGLLGALGAAHPGSVGAYALTWRGHGDLAAQLPGGVRPLGRRVPARAVHALWERGAVARAESFLGPVDVVHGTNYVVPPTRRAGAVVSVHDMTPVRFPALCTPAVRRFPRLVAAAIARGAHVHVDSGFVGDEVIEHFGADPGRVHVVPLGVDVPPPETVGPPAGTPDRYVLSVGTIEPRKDYPLLVRAFDALAHDDTDLALMIVGPDGWDAGALDSAVAASAHRDRIHRVGYVPAADRWALLRSARVLAYPSIYEGFGLPPLEAMAVGTPVVATAAGAVPETVGDAALLVPVGDADALAGALGRAAGDDALRRDLVERGRARAAGYTWEACASAMWRVYELAASR